jgi:cell division initiation protein
MKKDKRIVVPQEPRTRLTAVDVQQQQFRRSFRGYDEQEVDDFLDRVTEDVGALLEENERLKEQARLAPTTPVEGAAEAAEASRTLADLERRAQEQADSIVRDAEARAEAMVKDAQSRAPATGRGEGDPSGRLSRFVTKERAFLQDLAELIQSHAEAVKQMVQEARSVPAPPSSAKEEAGREEVREAEPARAPAAPSFPSPPSFAPKPPSEVAVSRSREPFGPAGASAGRNIDETADAEMAVAGTAEAEEAVEPPRPVIQVPDADSPASVAIGGPSGQHEEDDRAARERKARERDRDRDSSLSDLFWGED